MMIDKFCVCVFASKYMLTHIFSPSKAIICHWKRISWSLCRFGANYIHKHTRAPSITTHLMPTHNKVCVCSEQGQWNESHSLQCDIVEENKKIACDNGIKCHHCCWHKKTIKCHLQLLIVVTQHATTTCLWTAIELNWNETWVLCVLRV